MLVLAILLFIPLALLWPVQGMHQVSSTTYIHAALPKAGRTPVTEQRSTGSRSNSTITITEDRDEVADRQVRIDEELSCTSGGPAYAGVLTIAVTGPGSAVASLSLDIATRTVTAVDPGVKVIPGKPLPESGVRALYEAAGVDLAADPQIAAEADAVQGVILAALKNPHGSSWHDISVDGKTQALECREGPMYSYPTGPFLVRWGVHFSAIPVYIALVLASYAYLLRRALAARRKQAGPAHSP